MKKKLFYLILALMATTTIIAIYNGSDIIPKIATNQNTTPKKETETKTEPLPDYKNVDNQMNEPVESLGMIFTINSATISKNIGQLPVFEGLEENLARNPQIDAQKSFDKNHNFIDNNNYLQLGITWENPTNQDQEVYLNNNMIYNIKDINDKCLLLEAQLTTTNFDYTKKNTFAYTLKSKEKITFYLGYTITDQEAEEFKNNMFLSLNIHGAPFMYEDKERKGIKLKFD